MIVDWPIIMLCILCGFALGALGRQELERYLARRQRRRRTERLADLVGCTAEDLLAPECATCGRTIPGQLQGERCARCIERAKRGELDR